MFGYVTIDKMELKFKEYYSYKGYYCGLCMCLKNKYGNISRMTLNYDMTFLILLLSSLYEPQNKIYKSRCIVHPIKEQYIIQNSITEYAAAINVILSYYNLEDNWNDDKDLKSLALCALLKKDFKKSTGNLVEKSEKIKMRLKNISEFEKVKSDDVDAVSNEFGHLMEEIILYKEDMWQKYLRKIGFFLGKYIYLLDAYEDMQKDEKNNSYNPFLNIISENIYKYANDMLELNLSFLSHAVERLPLIQDKGIIDNIIYSGILNKLKNLNELNKSNELNKLKKTTGKKGEIK